MVSLTWFLPPSPWPPPNDLVAALVVCLKRLREAARAWRKIFSLTKQQEIDCSLVLQLIDSSVPPGNLDVCCALLPPQAIPGIILWRL